MTKPLPSDDTTHRRPSALERQRQAHDLSEHVPSSHRRYADRTIERIRREAAAIGPSTALRCELVLEHRPHPEQGFRACLGIVRQMTPFGARCVEAAASRALEIGARAYGSVKSILHNNLDRQAQHRRAASDPAILQAKIRGARYYNCRTFALTHPTLDQLTSQGAEDDPCRMAVARTRS